MTGMSSKDTTTRSGSTAVSLQRSNAVVEEVGVEVVEVQVEVVEVVGYSSAPGTCNQMQRIPALRAPAISRSRLLPIMTTAAVDSDESIPSFVST